MQHAFLQAFFSCFRFTLLIAMVPVAPFTGVADGIDRLVAEGSWRHRGQHIRCRPLRSATTSLGVCRVDGAPSRILGRVRTPRASQPRWRARIAPFPAFFFRFSSCSVVLAAPRDRRLNWWSDGAGRQSAGRGRSAKKPRRDREALRREHGYGRRTARQHYCPGLEPSSRRAVLHNGSCRSWRPGHQGGNAGRR